MAGTDAILNGESLHPQSLEGKQVTTTEWNENVKCTAVWRCRNESLLKAMHNSLAANVDTDEFGGLNAHKSYLGLKSRYHISENRGTLELYNVHLSSPIITLEDSPKDIAKMLQAAFNKYNSFFGHNNAQRLPTNFLKLEFLNPLDHVYDGWVRALLNDNDVLELEQGPVPAFDDLVDLVVLERDHHHHNS
ncbi:hypothetical protein E4T42_08809 [Aureobasidium subglaciale]|nr:hypothetical protein E4T42_08809 [Aureobasidium subglaciale]